MSPIKILQMVTAAATVVTCLLAIRHQPRAHPSRRRIIHPSTVAATAATTGLLVCVYTDAASFSRDPALSGFALIAIFMSLCGFVANYRRLYSVAFSDDKPAQLESEPPKGLGGNEGE